MKRVRQLRSISEPASAAHGRWTGGAWAVIKKVMRGTHQECGYGLKWRRHGIKSDAMGKEKKSRKREFGEEIQRIGAVGHLGPKYKTHTA